MEKLIEIAKEVSIALAKRKETISVIESSSGGLISSALLAQPGASVYYIGGQVIYTAKAIKNITGLRLRDLKDKNIRSSSEPFALLLGEKGIEIYGTDWCITETGAAGPSGNGYGDPPGYSCFAISSNFCITSSVKYLSGFLYISFAYTFFPSISYLPATFFQRPPFSPKSKRP